MNGAPELWVTASVGEPLTFPLMSRPCRSMSGAPELWVTALVGEPLTFPLMPRPCRSVNGAPELWVTASVGEPLTFPPMTRLTSRHEWDTRTLMSQMSGLKLGPAPGEWGTRAFDDATCAQSPPGSRTGLL